MAAAAVNLIRLRWPGRCAACDLELESGSQAWHDARTRSVRCTDCGRPSAETTNGAVPSLPPSSPQSDVVDLGVAGRGARRRHAELRERREQQARERLGWLGVAATRIVAEPQGIAAWKTGAEGEERLAGILERRLANTHATMLHDRRMPRSTANIDHLAVGLGGVTVIDAKNVSGPIRVASEGGLLSPRVTLLRIQGRNRTKLVDGVERQVAAVEAALRTEGFGDIPVRGALCFLKTEGLPMFGLPDLRGVALVGPRGAAKLAARPGDLDAGGVNDILELLAERFPVS